MVEGLSFETVADHGDDDTDWGSGDRMDVD